MRHVTTGLLVLACIATVSTQAPPPIRGFFGDSAASERDVEKKFQAIPSPENLREYMRATSAEPHHAGSAGSRKVADYVLAKFTSWGLDARRGQVESRMP